MEQVKKSKYEGKSCSVCGDNYKIRYSSYEGERKGEILCNKHLLQIKRNGTIADSTPSKRRDERKCDICGDTNNVCQFGNEGRYHGMLICGRHTMQIRTHGDILDTFKKDREKERKCDICGDVKSVRQVGFSLGEWKGTLLCLKHYSQIRKHKTITDKNPSHTDRERVCEVENCQSNHEVFYCRKTNQMLCRRHWDHVYNYGKILNRTVFDRNEIIAYEDHAEIIMYDHKNNEVARTKIDLSDIDNVDKYKWRLGTWRYAETKNTEGKSVALHNILIKTNSNEIIDHIDRNPLNNRRNNLRVVDKSVNAINSGLRQNNQSGVTGVSYSNRTENWRSYINYQGKRIELGMYKEKYLAIISRLQAELKYYPDYPPQKHLFKEYGIEEE